MVPKRSASVNQPATAPGMDTLAGWSLGITSCPSDRIVAADTFEPAHPDALSAAGRGSPGRQIKANRSPPIPHVSGATAPWTAFAAIAASTALPPRESTSIAVIDVRTWGLATAPPNPRASPRPVVNMTDGSCRATE